MLFRVEGHHAILARIPDFLDLAGTVSVAAARRNAASIAALRRPDRRQVTLYECDAILLRTSLLVHKPL